ncbi:MAG TPA: peptidylprolyl isomerase [Planctomycetota bacterium]|nr:peptidylprolyl isomerase [Planctomycetota bacterium]
MNRWLPIVLCAALAGCDEKPKSLVKPGAKGEPKKVRVLHVLIAFQGAERAAATVTRTQDEAEVLAGEILGRARRGEDFKKLVKDYSSDKVEGGYVVVNHGFPTHGAEKRRADLARSFANVSFSLGVGEIGLAPFHKLDSPFGFHVIKRIE